MTTVGRPAFEIAGITVPPGRRARFELPIGKLTSGTPLAIPGVVVHGPGEGPTVWLSGAIHGDEICGVEIIRQVLEAVDPGRFSGTLIAVPIVNVHGFNTGDRYLPDRRDLNRVFPGSPRGSLASRIAHLFMTEVVARADVGIDFHSGSDLRVNLPQVRADLDDEATAPLVDAFAAPISIHSRIRNGSIRQAATEAGAPVLVYEGGEADRFDSRTIEAGRDGTLRVLERLGLIDTSPPAFHETLRSRKSTWVRAPRSGILHLDAELGARVEAGTSIATILDPFGSTLGSVRARAGGIVIGHTQHPLVNRGDAVAHIAEIEPAA